MFALSSRLRVGDGRQKSVRRLARVQSRVLHHYERIGLEHARVVGVPRDGLRIAKLVEAQMQDCIVELACRCEWPVRGPRRDQADRARVAPRAIRRAVSCESISGSGPLLLEGMYPSGMAQTLAPTGRIAFSKVSRSRAITERYPNALRSTRPRGASQAGPAAEGPRVEHHPSIGEGLRGGETTIRISRRVEGREARRP